VPLSKDAFLAYAYVYTADDWRAKVLFDRLWKDRASIGNMERESADIEYSEDAQVLRVQHTAVHPLIGPKNFNARDFWRQLAIFRREHEKFFAPHGVHRVDVTKITKVPADLVETAIAQGVLTKGSQLRFHGALIHGVTKNGRVSWFGVRADQSFLQQYATAVSQTTRATGFQPRDFDADCRATLIADWINNTPPIVAGPPAGMSTITSTPLSNEARAAIPHNSVKVNPSQRFFLVRPDAPGTIHYVRSRSGDENRADCGVQRPRFFTDQLADVNCDHCKRIRIALTHP
jgi:hypothetical protein